MRMKNRIFSRFTDIDECKAGLAKCKEVSYCRNEIGSYYCSCIPNIPILNWVAGFVKLDYSECYGKNLQYSFQCEHGGAGADFQSSSSVKPV